MASSSMMAKGHKALGSLVLVQVTAHLLRDVRNVINHVLYLLATWVMLISVAQWTYLLKWECIQLA